MEPYAYCLSWDAAWGGGLLAPPEVCSCLTGHIFYFACLSSHGMLRSSMAPLAQKIEQAAGMAEVVVPLSIHVQLACSLLLTAQHQVQFAAGR